MSNRSVASIVPETLTPADTPCFHCDLPLPAGQPALQLEVLGAARHFCCPGCQAVCQAITSAGLSDYYRYRTDPAASASRQLLPDFLKQLYLYDRPEIQQDFVTREAGWCEAALLLEDIRCPACLWLNERHLRSLNGVLDVHIDDITQRARVRWDPGVIRLSEILKAIADIGYMAHPYDAARSEQLHKLRRRRSTERLIFAGAAGMIVMNFSLATYFMGGYQADGQLPLWIILGRWSSLLVVSILLAYSGQEFFAAAWHDLKQRRLGMDVPVVLGLTFAWLGSLHATVLQQGEVYYDSIAMFVFLLLLARRWELRGKLQAADRLERLARVTPATAARLDAAGELTEVAVTELAAGDRIRILPGETLPVDATIIRGSSSFDESLLTGESQPVLHRPGDAVMAGCVNGEQPVTVRVIRPLQTSAVSKIRQLVERGLEQRPRYAILAEQAAAWFVAVLLLIATATALFWLQTEPSKWLSSTIAVLIVTCPCALALATPVALAVSAGRFIELGVLPLRMRALDALAGSDLFVFDKTGTLTAGQPALAAVMPLGNLQHGEILCYAAALATQSGHPLARALRQVIPVSRIALQQVVNVPGSGIRAQVAGQEWRLGRPQFVASEAALAGPVAAVIETCRTSGQLVALLANAGGIQAVLAFEDPLRPGVEELLAGLEQTGVRQLAILSGDARSAVSRLGKQLGIQDCHAGMSPADKLAWTRNRQRAGHRVAMLGDGINDAPTLAAADVSISFAEGADLANVSSDFLVLGDNAAAVADARRLAQQTRRNILQNFAWALAYNLVAVPVAAAGWLPPWGAALGMACSSLFVVMHALRLQKPIISNSSNSQSDRIVSYR